MIKQSNALSLVTASFNSPRAITPDNSFMLIGQEILEAAQGKDWKGHSGGMLEQLN